MVRHQAHPCDGVIHQNITLIVGKHKSREKINYELMTLSSSTPEEELQRQNSKHMLMLYWTASTKELLTSCVNIGWRWALSFFFNWNYWGWFNPVTLDRVPVIRFQYIQLGVVHQYRRNTSVIWASFDS